MNTKDALTYAIAVLSGGPEWHDQTAAAEALERLRDALKPHAEGYAVSEELVYAATDLEEYDGLNPGTDPRHFAAWMRRLSALLSEQSDD